MNMQYLGTAVISMLLLACTPPLPASFLEGRAKVSNAVPKSLEQIEQPSKATILQEVAEKAKPNAVHSWALSGSIAVRSKSKAWSAAVYWLEQGPHVYQIRFLGPLGGGAMLIEKRGGVVTIQEGGKTSSSSQAQTLLRARTGVNLPVENLYYWVRGIPAPGAKSVQKDQHHRITELQQAGFLIRYGAYASIKGQILPTHIQVQGQGVFLKLVVKQWKI